jgi:hypothetical protein
MANTAFEVPVADKKNNTHFSPSMWIEHHPFFAGFTFVAVVLMIIYIMKHGVTSASSTTSTTAGTQPFLVQGQDGLPGPPGPPGPSGTLPPPGPPGQTIPIPKGQWNTITNNTPWQFGRQVTLNGVTYTIGPGTGVIWGVAGSNIPFNTWQNTPIGPNGKIALYYT